MATLELAKKKWASKMATAGPIWKRKVTDKVKVWASNFAKFLGLPDVNLEKKTRYTEGIGRVTAEDFASAVKGKEETWASRLREAFM